MRNSYFEDLEKTIGLWGMRSLLADLTCSDINNWRLAKKWDMTIHDIRFLRHETLELCGYVLLQEKKASYIPSATAKIYSLSA